MEPLEGRSLLSVVTVDTALDVVDAADGYTSLREAVAYANTNAGDDTIEFSASLLTGGRATITLTQGELGITDAAGKTTIRGPGASELTISGNDSSRVFNVAGGAVAEIAGVTIANGYGALKGGGIYNAGTLSLTDCVVSDNALYSDYTSFGGGIYNDGTLTIAGCLLADNTVTGMYFAVASAVYNSSKSTSLTVSDSAFTGNLTDQYETDGSHTRFGVGAIYNASTLTISHCSFSDNRVTSGGTGGVVDNIGTATIADSVFSGNSGEDGGALRNYSGTLRVTGCSFSGNSATGNGGAIENASSGAVIVSQCSFSDNSATENGGAISSSCDVTVAESVFSGNSAGGYGGAVHNTCSLSMSDCTVSGNTAYYGGAGVYSRSSRTVTLDGCTLSGNEAVYSGGGVYHAYTGTLVLTNSTFSGNSAMYGGGIYAAGPVTATNVTVASNSATSGGGVYDNDTTSTTTLNNTIVADNANTDSTSPDVFGTVTANYCLIENTTGAVVNTDYDRSNVTGLDPRLGALADNGGPTQTMALRAGSPAIDAGSDGLVPADITTDQRGEERIVNGTVDIGAYEAAATAAGPTISTPTVTATTSAAKTTIVWTVSDDAGLGVTTLTIDGNTVKVGKKSDSKTASTFTYSGAQAAGDHSYTITARNKAGESSTCTGAFTVEATTPVISKVSAKATTSNRTTTIVWTVTDIDGVDSTTLQIDGVAISPTKRSGKATSRTYTYTGYVAAGTHTYTIDATDAADVSAVRVSGSFEVEATTPTITKVKAAAATSADTTTISWNAADCDGIQYAAISVDGAAAVTVSPSDGSTDSAASYLYSAAISAGKHAFTITVVDARNLSKTATGKFTVKATTPTVSTPAVTATTSADPTAIAWSVTDVDGIRDCSLTIDGKAVDEASVTTTPASDTAVDYVYSGVLAAGKHTYAITAVDSVGTSKKVSGSLTVAATTPAISGVVVTPGTSAIATTIAWSVYDLDGIGSVKLSINGKSVKVTKTPGDGVTAAYGYSGVLTAGTYSYTITVVDARKASAAVDGTFSVVPAGLGETQAAALASLAGGDDRPIVAPMTLGSTRHTDSVDAVFAAY